MTAALIVSHGSHSDETRREVEELLAKIKDEHLVDILQYAFLDVDSPTIPQGVENCVRAGARHVIVVLNFLNSGKHVDEDIPQLVAAARAQHPNVRISLTKPVGQHEKIPALFCDLIRGSV